MTHKKANPAGEENGDKVTSPGNLFFTPEKAVVCIGVSVSMGRRPKQHPGSIVNTMQGA
jgi:hypothetical protein